MARGLPSAAIHTDLSESVKESHLNMGDNLMRWIKKNNRALELNYMIMLSHGEHGGTDDEGVGVCGLCSHTVALQTHKLTDRQTDSEADLNRYICLGEESLFSGTPTSRAESK